MPPPTNRLITRGMGPSRGVPGRTGLIVQGFGGVFRAAIEAAKRVIRLGQSGTKRALQGLEEIIIGAKLLRVNDQKPANPVQGHITVRVDMSRRIAVMAEGVSKRARAAWEDVKISVKRVK